jgi:hypothetical protein
MNKRLHANALRTSLRVRYRHIDRSRPPPTEAQISDTPPRVQVAASPPRVQNLAISLKVVLPTITNITVQNSHLLLQPTPRRAVTPPTPHPMVRIIAPPQNLSHDMLAETVQQSNHVLSLPIAPPY